jgi:ATP synthase protein I
MGPAASDQTKMFRVVALQAGTTLLGSILAAAIFGWPAAFSALLGGMACTLPNALFALQLTMRARLPSPGSREGPRAAANAAVGLLAGEFFKVILTVALMVAAARGYPQMVWPAMILALIAALMVQPAAYAWRRNG